ncbi:MAG: phosphoribosyltransferase family protein [bacterium]|nr:phosphoribosyltransferase family protein [bacterium]
MTGTWRRASARFVDALLPTGCVVCAQPLRSPSPGRPSAFCGECARALPWWRRADGCPRCGGRRTGPSGCPRCLAMGSALQASHAALRYSGPIARWIPASKRAQGRPSVAVERAIDALADALGERVAREAGGHVDLVTSLPLHAARQRERGFNQADALARRVAARLGRPFRPDLLERFRPTRPQASLRGEARRENVRRAFRAPRNLPGDPRVALVDDVLTTGATLEAAASALLEAGALEVRGLALAATLPVTRRRPREGTRSRGAVPEEAGGS